MPQSVLLHTYILLQIFGIKINLNIISWFNLKCSQFMVVVLANEWSPITEERGIPNSNAGPAVCTTLCQDQYPDLVLIIVKKLVITQCYLQRGYIVTKPTKHIYTHILTYLHRRNQKSCIIHHINDEDFKLFYINELIYSSLTCKTRT